jgi:hypothetical protein
MGFHYVPQAGLKLLSSSDHLASVSQVTGRTVCLCLAQMFYIAFIGILYTSRLNQEITCWQNAFSLPGESQCALPVS